MRVLALDLSKRSTGYACWSPDDTRVTSGRWELGSEYSSRGRVFCKLHQAMSELHRLGAIDAVFFEEPIHPAQLQGGTNADTVKLAAGLAAHVESWGEAMGCRIVRAVNIATWRRHFLGRMPRATRSADLKLRAMERCRHLGFRPGCHDEAEAIGILDYACDDLRLKPYWSAEEVLRKASAGVSA